MPGGSNFEKGVYYLSGEARLIVLVAGIRLSEVHRKTGVELVSNGILGRNLGTKQKVMSQIRSHNTSVDEFSTSLYLNFGKANVEFHLCRPCILFVVCVVNVLCRPWLFVFFCVCGSPYQGTFFVKFTELSGTFLHCICSKSLLYFPNSYKTNSFAHSALLKTSISSSCNKSVKIKLPDLVQFVETTCSKPVDHKF